MSYTAPNRLLMPMRHSIDTITDSWFDSTLSYGPAVWPSANLAIYCPIRVPSVVIIKKLWLYSGTAGTGNVDMALYDTGGVAVVSATNAAKVASTTEQVLDVTDTVVAPGLYYLGLSSDSGTDTFGRYSLTAPYPAAMGVLTQASAYPLPATATFALDQTLTYVPVMGMLLVDAVS